MFQYLLYGDATPSTGPCGPAKIFDFRCQKKPKILEKSRAVRAKTTTMTDNNRDALDDGKNEDPAKMTYSIPDFVSRNTINTQ